MLLRKAQGRCSVGDYVWVDDDDVVEVPDWLGMELLAIKGHDYTEVLPHETNHESNVDWKPVEVGDEGLHLERGVEYEEEPDLNYVSPTMAENLKLLERFQEEAREVPTGTANQVMEWVGEDSRRATLALIVEKAKGDDARSSLITKLSRLTS